MPIPDVALTVKDNALGLGAAAAAAGQLAQLKIGISQKGTVRTVYAFAGAAAIQTLYDTLGDGPLTESAALVLAVGGVVYCMPATIVGAGSCGSVSHSGTGSAVIAAAGAAYDSYDVKVKVITAAANLAAAAAQIQYSLDGGLTYSATIAVPTGGTYVIPNTNITLTITDGTFVVADVYSFTSAAPTFDSTEMATCIDAALALDYMWGLLHIVGPASTASGAASLMASLETKLVTAGTAFRYARGMVEFPQDTDANLAAAVVSSAAPHCAGGGGFGNYISPINGRQMKRSVAWGAALRFSQAAPSEDLGRVNSGPIAAVTAVSRNERVTPALDPARFTTFRTFIGPKGIYLTNCNLFSSPGSDFKWMQHGRVMDIGCAVTYAALVNYVNASVRVDSTGKILEKDARAIEADVAGQLQAALLAPDTLDGPGYASAVSVVVDRAANILSTNILPVTVRITPRGYAKSIAVNIGFANPALTVQIAQ